MPTTVEITELSYVDPRQNSDKFYRVFVGPESVVCQYGRTGTYGTFTAPKPAKSAAKTISSKIAKGYVVVKAGTVTFADDPFDGVDESAFDDAADRLPFGGDLDASSTPVGQREQSEIVVEANTDADVDGDVVLRVVEALRDRGVTDRVSAPSGLATVPMLAEVAPKSSVESMLTHPRWVTQSKLDGERVVIEVSCGVVTVLNRNGQAKAKNVSKAMLAPFAQLADQRWVFDGEIVGRTLWLFDMPASAVHDESTPFSDRYRNLLVTIDELREFIENACIGIVDTHTTTEAKETHFAAAERDHKEGVIFRDSTGTYQAGRHDQLRKFKFLNEVDAFVTEVGRNDKQNAVVAVFDDEGNEVELGPVTTIGKGDIKVGDVLEVQFLYIVNLAHPTLVQPRILRKRTDKTAAECLTGQLVNAVTNKDVS